MAEQGTSRRLAAIVAADVAGYSRLMGSDEEGTLAALRMHRQELIDPKIGEYGGRIVKTMGDGLLIEISSVVDALRCCLDVQQDMVVRNHDTPVERRIQFRVGINLGDVIIDGDDMFGDGVNIAARMETIADPGGICITQAVLDLIKQKLALKVEDLGAKALKNIEDPVRTYRVVCTEQGNRPAAAKSSAGAAPDELLPLPQRPSLAIMPFRNLSGNPESDYIANGIGLGILTLLVQLSGLFSVNANEHRDYRDGKMTAADAVRELPVRYVLEGSVQQAGQHVRVMVQLTDLHNNVVIWADKYDRRLENVFALQDDVAREVISSLSGEILGRLDRIWTRGLTRDGAWECFLRGVSHFYKFTKRDNAIARDMFEKIYQLHPDKVIGPAYMAATHWFDATRGWADSSAASMKQAREWAEKSIEPEEENNGLGYGILGTIWLREGRHEEGLARISHPPNGLRKG